MFNVEQAPQQPNATGFALKQANYINLTSPSDKQLLIYVSIFYDDGSEKEETVVFSGLDYNSANTAFATWGGIMGVVEQRLGVKLVIPANIEEVFQNVPPPVEEPAPKVDESQLAPQEPTDPVPLPEQSDAPAA